MLEPEESPQALRGQIVIPLEGYSSVQISCVLGLPSFEVLWMDSQQDQAETMLLGETKLGGGCREVSNGGN